MKVESRSESECEQVFSDNIYTKDSLFTSEKRLVNVENGQMGGTHWTCFYIKDKISFYFDSFGGAPDKFLLNQLTKPKIYPKLKNQHFNSKIFGTYCLCFFLLVERRENNHATSEKCFG